LGLGAQPTVLRARSPALLGTRARPPRLRAKVRQHGLQAVAALSLAVLLHQLKPDIPLQQAHRPMVPRARRLVLLATPALEAPLRASQVALGLQRQAVQMAA